MLPCRHTFHVTCLRAWLQQSRAGSFSCPMCRASLLAEEERGQHPWAAAQAAAGRGAAGPAAAAAAWEQLAGGGAGSEGGAPAVEPVGALLAGLLAGAGAQGGAGAAPPAAPGLSSAASGGAGSGEGGEEVEGPAWAGAAAGAAARPPFLHERDGEDFWREVAYPSDEELAGGSGITLTDDEGCSGGSDRSASVSRGAAPTASTCRCRSAGIRSRGGGGGGGGGGAEEAATAAAAAPAAAGVLGQLRAASQAVSQLVSRAAGRPAGPSEAGRTGQGGGTGAGGEEVDQPVPRARHAYNTRRSKSPAA